MQFVGQYQTFLVIPTGATTGQRIEINVNNSGAIQVFNSSNVLIDSIDQNGFTAYNSTGNSYGRLSAAALTFGGYNPGTGGTTPDGSSITSVPDIGAPNDFGQLIIKSPRGNSGTPDQAILTLQSGNTGAASGSGLNPQVILTDGVGGTAVDVVLPGNVIRTGATWVIPSLNAGFVNVACQYRVTPLDGLWWQGEMSITAAQAAAGSLAIFTLPVGIRPIKELIVPASWRTTGGTSKGGNAFFAFEPTGVVFVGFSGATAANDRFSCSALVALNIIP